MVGEGSCDGAVTVVVTRSDGGKASLGGCCWAAALMLIRVLCDSLVLIMEGEEMAMVSRLKKEEEWRREFFFWNLLSLVLL